MSKPPGRATTTAGAGAGVGHHHHHHHHGIQEYLLEMTIISAQDLHCATLSMHTYATAWVHPDHKLHTGTDPAGGADPTWNDRFVFRVDDAFLRSDTSAITVDIYAARRLRSAALLGTARILLSSVVRPAGSPGTRVIALQVRRPASLRPQGILNVGVSLLDPCTKSMPLIYSALGAFAFAHNDLVGRSFKDPGLKQSPVVDDGDRWKLERCTSVEVGGWVVEKEMKVLESKLEQWRTELPAPVQATGRSNRRTGRGGGGMSCFCGGSSTF